jgi:formylglycine-generating enzyme required for sulfatase activity
MMRASFLLMALAAVPLHAQDITYTNSIGMKFTLIQPGTMQVGVYQPTCPDPNAPARPFAGFGGPGGPGGNRAGGAAAPSGAPATPPRTRQPADPRTVWTPADIATCEKLVKQDTMPGFSVTLKKPYYIGIYEVTQEQYKKVMGTNPSVFQGSKVSDDAAQHPVDSVTWQDAQAFVKKLNILEHSKAYRLPTEFEWEYAGRAGGPGQVPWADIRAQAWEQLGNQPNATTHTVGTKEPNAWGLYDMLGNVWEWVADVYNDKIFPDPTPPTKGDLHVLKGGSFLGDVKNSIYATHGAGPGDGFNVGFRIVRDVTQTKQ